MKTLILYSTYNGQTQKISNFLAKKLENKLQCTIVNIMDAKNINTNWDQYDSILIGAAIRYGHFHPYVVKFVKQNLNKLQNRRSGFFSVNLTARNIDKCIPEKNPYTLKFFKKTSWKPDCCAIFAGAIMPTKYNLLDRLMIKLVIFITDTGLSLNKDVEYTDWNQVSNFAEHFIMLNK